METVIHSHAKQYYEFFTTHGEMTLDVANRRTTIPISVYIKKTDSRATATINTVIRVRRSGISTDDDEYRDSACICNLATMAVGETYKFFQYNFHFLCVKEIYVIDEGWAWVVASRVRITTRDIQSVADPWSEESWVDVPYVSMARPKTTSFAAENTGLRTAKITFKFDAPYTSNVFVYSIKDGIENLIYVRNNYEPDTEYTFDVNYLTPNTTYWFGIEYMCLNGQEGGRYYDSNSNISLLTLPNPITSIDFPDIRIEENEYISIAATVNASADIKEVTWKSSNPAIFQVLSYSGLTLNARSQFKGSATLTAKAKDWGGFSFSKLVYVMRYAKSIVPVPSSLVLEVGEKFKMACVIYPIGSTDKNIEYSIGDSMVATVNSNGVVEGVGMGLTDLSITVLRNYLPTNLVENVPVFVVLEHEWKVLTLPQYITPHWLYEYHINLRVICRRLNFTGWVPLGIDEGVATGLYAMMDIFNAVEENIDLIHAAFDGSDTLYDKKFTWTAESIGYSPVKRWVDWANQIYTLTFTG